jgi:hypothetical protein
LVIGFCVDLNAGMKNASVSIALNAYSVLHFGKGEGNGWGKLLITANRDIVFSWVETPRNTNIVLNYPVAVFKSDNVIGIDFDPLHKAAYSGMPAISRFFIGGRDVEIEIIKN